MIVIKDLDHECTEPSQPPTQDFESPFADQAAETCWQTLYAMVERTKSDFDTESFAVVDERSVKDASALLVLAFQKDNGVEVETVRVGLELVPSILGSWMAKGENMEELVAEAAKSSDGVYR